jgi:hypothetical protein
MTAQTMLTLPTRREEDANFRPVPWRRMAWIIWRQHRIALAGMAAFLGAVAWYVWIAGLHLHHAHAAATACHPASSLACADLINRFNGMYPALANGTALQAVPALIGAFVGAPVLARELETGTFRYAWTQGFGRWRWTLAKLVVLAVMVTAAASAASVLLSWYYQPYFATGNQGRSLSELSPLSSALFDLRGVAFVAWTLAAFAIGVLAGMVIRRNIPAIVATLAAYTGLALVAANLLRRHYLTPLLTSKVNVPGSAWIYSQWWTQGGKFAFAGSRPPFNLIQQFCPTVTPTSGNKKPSLGTLAQCLAQHGYTQWTRYQPASRFWTFQGIEGGWLLALSALLIAVTIWLVRHRTS